MAQQATREFWVSDGVDDAVRKAKLTLKKLGELTAVVPGQHVVGTVQFGVQHVTMKISWRSEDVESKMDAGSGVTTQPAQALGTMLILEGTLPNGNSDVAIRSAFERFEEAYLHFDRGDYQPDRWGVLPWMILIVLMGVIAVGFLLSKTTNVFKPTPTASASATATETTDTPATNSQ